MRLLHKVFFWIWRESSQDEYHSKTCSGGGGRVARQREKIRGSSRTASPAGKGTCRVGPTLDFAGCPTRRARNLRTLVPGFTGCKIDLGIASPFRMWETMLGGMGDIKPA